jgi:hypothetical protein
LQVFNPAYGTFTAGIEGQIGPPLQVIRLEKYLSEAHVVSDTKWVGGGGGVAW